MKYILACVMLLVAPLVVAGQQLRVTATDGSELHQLKVTGDQDILVTIDGFTAGDRFEVFIAEDRFEQLFSFGNVGTKVQRLHDDYVMGQAEGETVELCIAEELSQAGVLYLAVKKIGAATEAEKMMTITTSASTNGDSLLNTVFRDESCFELFFKQLRSGQATLNDGRMVRQTGTFENGGGIVDIDRGIILTTGFVSGAPGPNDPFIPTSGIYPGIGVADAEAASLTAPFDFFDVAFIEFEFVPTTDFISFDYVFFSEEYCFAINSSFGNDAFGFFLTGPDGVTRNIATLPNGDPITASTLNHTTFPNLFLDNSPPGSFSPCTAGPIPPERLAGISYDGFSTKLTASATVTPCDTHTLKLVVVDAFDNFIDSGVLLEAGSFTAGLISDPEPSVQGVAGSIEPVEGCDIATITFERLFFDSADLELPLEVNYNIITTGGLNMADEGVDYSLLPSPFVIPPGDTTGVLEIPILADGDSGEGVEAFVIRYDGTCNCAVNTDTFYIQDAVDLSVTLNAGPVPVTDNIQLCAGQEVILEALSTGGNSEYTYDWPDGQDTSRVTFTATGQDTLVIVDVMDGCGLVGRDSIQVIAPDISATITATDFSLCTNTEVQIPIDVEGTDRYFIVLQIDTGAVSRLDTFLITQDTNFTFDYAAVIRIAEVSDLSGCGGGTNGVATIITGDIEVTPTLDQPTCDDDNGGVSIQVDGGNANFTFAWDDGPSTSPVRTNLGPGSYEVTVTRNSDTSCPQVFSYDLLSTTPLVIDSIDYLRPDCPGETITLAPVVSGGTPPYSFSWPDSASTDSILTITTQSGFNVYPVIVTDFCGVETTESAVINLPDFSAELNGRLSLCNQISVDVPITISGPAGDYTLELQIDSAGITVDRNLTVSGPGTTSLSFPDSASITLVSISNAGGCTGTINGGAATVVDPQLSINGSFEPPSCPTGDDGSISLTPMATVPISVSWSDGPSTGLNRTGLTAGLYEVTISDAVDPTCFVTETYALVDPFPISVNISSAQNPTCPYERDTLIPILSGGTPPFTYEWSVVGQTDSLLPIIVPGGDSTFTVIVRDSCDNSAFFSWNYGFEDVTAAISGDFGICNDPFNVDVPLNLSGSSSYTVVIRENGNQRTLNLTGSTTINYNEETAIELVSVTGADGCPGRITDTFANVLDASWDVTADITDVRCRTESTGAINVNVNNNSGAYDFVWSPASATGAAPDNLPAGTYFLTVTDQTAFACLFDTFFVVTEPGILLGQALTPAFTCVEEDLVLAALPAGGTLPYRYDWANGMGTDSLFSITTVAGNSSYPLAITDDCGVVVRDTVFINLPTVEASVSGTFGICNAPFEADVPILLSGSSAYTLTIRENGVERTLNVTQNTSINYTEATVLELVSVLGADGCPGMVVDTFANIIDANFQVAAQLTDVNCRTEATGAISLDVNGDSGAYRYDWNPASAMGASPSGLTAGTYSVTITDTTPSACVFDTFFVISEPDLFLGAAVPAPVACPDETATLAATHQGGTPPFSYDWDNGLGSDSLYTVTTQGGNTSYPLLITDDCGNEVRDTVFFNLPDVRAEVSGNFSVCNAPFNADVPLTFSGSNTGYEFVIRENGVDRTLFATGDTSLNYTDATTVQLISVSARNGCDGVAGGIADVTNADWSVTAQVQDVLCSGRPTGSISVIVNGNNGAYTFNWSRPGLSGSTVTGLTAGIYDLTVTETGPTACSWDTTFSILQPASAITFLRDSSREETCRSLAFASATYSGGTGDLTYTWSNGTTGNVLGEVSAGSYDLTITDENGCEIVRNFNLQDRTSVVLAAVSASAPELSCTLMSLDLTAAQNTQTVTYAWTDTDDNDLGSSRTISVTAPGRYYVTVVNPANGCSAIDSINVSQSADLLDLEIEAITALNCNNNSVDLSVSHPAFTGGVSYEWRLNNAVVGNSATLSAVTQVGTYIVVVTRDDNGCPTLGQTEVILDRDPPTATIAGPLVALNCRLPDVSLAVSATGPVTYSWSTTNGNLTGATTTPTTMADRPGLYTVVVTDTLNGCTTTRTVTVVADGDQLVTNAGTDQVLVCTGLGTVLNGSVSPNLPGSEGRWYGPDGMQFADDFQAFAQSPGDYVFESIHPVSGCSAFDTVRVFSEAPTSVSYAIVQPPCPEVGGRVIVREVTGLNPPYTFSSPQGETDPLGTGVRGLPEGTNVLIVTDALGCELRDTFQIFGNGTFDGWADDITIALGEEAELGVQTDRGDGALVQWTWSNIPDTLSCLDCPNPVARPMESFVALVAVTDSNGCVATIRQNVFVTERSLIYIPTGFSPLNGDGVNDVLTVFGDAEFVEIVSDFQIFDRWGNRVFGNRDFQVNDFAAGWDGSYAGNLSPPAVYVYTATVRYVDGTEETMVGEVTLVR